MNRALFVLVGITCLASAPAFAEDATKPPDAPKTTATEAKPSTSRGGLWSLQLDGPAFPMWQAPAPYNATRGVGVTTGGGNTNGSAGIGGSLGYSLTDMIELGGAVGFLTNSVGTGFNIEPFLKLNLSSEMTATLNPFAMVGFGFNFNSPKGQTSVTFITPELAAGVEYMLTHSFGISVYVPLTLSIPTTNGSSIFGIGLGYGLVGYF